MLALYLFIILFKNHVLATSRSGSGSHTSSSHNNDLIYDSTSISPFFDDGASSSLLPKPLSPKPLLPSATSVQPTAKTSLPASDATIKKTKGKYTKSDYRIERVRASWTPERRKQQAEYTRAKNLKRGGPDHAAKISASWTKERKTTQAEITRKARKGSVHSKETREKMSKVRLGIKKSQATKDKIRQAISRAHALRREQKEKEERSKDKGE